MKNAIPILFILITLLISTLHIYVYAVAPREAVVEVYPAPIGYTIIFQSPYPTQISGYRDEAGNFYQYRANLKNNGIMILVGDINSFKTVISPEGTSSVKIVNDLKLEAYGIVAGKDSFVLFTGGRLYTSRYYIYINRDPPTLPSNNIFQNRLVLVIYENVVDFRLANYYYTLGLSVSSQNSGVSIYTKDGTLLSMRLSDLLGVDEACITWFSNLPSNVYWVGGVALSPTCTSNIKVLKTYVYNDRPYAVVFSLSSKYGNIDYVIMARPFAAVLSDVGILTYISTPRYMHIAKGLNLELMNIYIAPSDRSYIIAGKKLNVTDITQVVTANKDQTKNYVCMLPSKASLVFALTWRYINITGTTIFNPLPGEIILLSADNNYYLCHGDLSWMDNTESPQIKASEFKEIVYPIQLYTLSGQSFLTVLANGKVYSTNNVIIDYSEYSENEVYVYAARYIRRISITQTSIFLTPFFIIAVLIALVFIGVIAFRGRGRQRELIKIILDFPKSMPMKVASDDDISNATKKHVSMFGTCPDIYDIAIYHNLLPQLPEKVDPTQEVVICPFNTNPETESVLRYISNVLLSVLWVTKRTSVSAGYFYTVIGNTMLYAYFYKHEGESIERAIVNAVSEAMRIKILSPFYLLPLGLVIITTDSKLSEFKNELEYMKVLSTAGGETVRSYAISSYITVKNIPTRVPPDELQRFMNEKIPVILVVSRSNVGEFLKYLEEKLTSYAKFYYEKLLGEKE